MDENNNQANPQNDPAQAAANAAEAQVTKDIQDFHKLHPNRKLMIFGLVLFIFIISIAVGIIIARSRSTAPNPETTNEQTTPAEVSQDQTVLSMTPSAETVAVGETVTVTVSLENAAVQATDVVINFDPAVFTASDIVNGTVYDNIFKSEIDEGQLLVSASVSPSNPQALNTGELFSFTLEALAAGDGTLSFDEELTITAKNGVNTLGSANGVTITVQ